MTYTIEDARFDAEAPEFRIEKEVSTMEKYCRSHGIYGDLNMRTVEIVRWAVYENGVRQRRTFALRRQAASYIKRRQERKA